jgi:hypothetical protein
MSKIIIDIETVGKYGEFLVWNGKMMEWVNIEETKEQIRKKREKKLKRILK